MVQINKNSTPNVRPALCIIPVFLFVPALAFFLLCVYIYIYIYICCYGFISSPKFEAWGLPLRFRNTCIAFSFPFPLSPPPSPHLSRGCSKHPDFQTRRGHFVFNYVESTSLPLPSTPHFIFVFSRFKLTFPRLIMLMIPNSITVVFVIPSCAQSSPECLPLARHWASFLLPV